MFLCIFFSFSDNPGLVEYGICIQRFMTTVWNKTLQQVRVTTAGAQPEATSVAVTIISAVYACSLLEMTMVLAAERLKTKPRESLQLEFIRRQIILIRERSDALAILADEDIRLFHDLLRSGLLKKRGRQPAALKEIGISRSIRVPLKAMEHIAQLVLLLPAGLPVCPPKLRSDLPAAANLLEAAIKNLVLTVKANTSDLDINKRTNISRAVTLLLSEVMMTTGQINNQVSAINGDET